MKGEVHGIMKRKEMKRVLLSLVLVIAMVTGMIWVPEGVQTKAADSLPEVTFYKTGRWQSVEGTRIVTESDLSAYGNYCKATVLLDGKEQLVGWQIAYAEEPTQGNASRYSLVPSASAGANVIPSTTKSLIVPKGTVFYKANDDTPIFQAGDDFALTYAGNYTAWPEGFTDAGFTMRWVADQTNGDTYVALNVDKTVFDLSTVYSSGAKFTSTVLVNDVKTTVTWEYIISGENQLIRSDYSVDSTNYITTDATRIELPERTFLIPQSGDKVPIRIASDIFLTELGTNNWVSGRIDMGLSYTAVYPQENFLQVQFTYSADLSSITESTSYVYLDTEIDGAVVENVKWVINKSAGKIYPDGTGTTVPATAKSVKIYAGTYSGGYAGTSCKIPIRITNDVGAMYVANSWCDASTVRTAEATYSRIVNLDAGKPQIQLTTDTVTPDGWKGWFNGTVYVDGEEGNARFYFEPSTQTLYVGQNDASDNVMSALNAHKKVKIKARTELSKVQTQNGPVILNLPEDLVLSWNGSDYVVGPQEITTNLSYKKIYIPEGKDGYQLNLEVDNYTDLVADYGLWSWLEGTIQVNGEDRKVAFQLGSDLFATMPTEQNANAGLPLDATSFEIPAGTTFEDVDQSSINILKVANSLSYVKVDGTWYEKGTEPDIYTTNVSLRGITAEETAYRLHLTVDNYADLVTKYGEWTWLEGTIKVNGEERTVAFNLGSDLLATFASTQNDKAGLPLNTTSIEIPAGTIFTAVTGSSTTPLKITNRFFYEKIGATWATYTSEYEYPNGNVLYYNIDNGSGYTLTSTNGAIEVKELPELVKGDTISRVGTYNITRVENEILYKEKIVLYKHGDVDESNGIDVRDIVAMKWAQAGTSEKQNARLAGMYAADIDRSGKIDGTDLLALRRAIASDDAEAELSVSKGNSVLNGVMPIAGYSAPIAEAYITDAVYDLIAGTGINMITYCGNDYNNSTSRALAGKQLQLAEARNLKLYVTDESAKDQTAESMPIRIGRYSMYHSFAGLNIVDEPTYGSVYVNSHGRPIADYASAIQLYKNSANINGYMNLFPYYSDTSGATTTNYKVYLDNTFTSTDAEVLSYDHYAIRTSEGNWWESLLGTTHKKVVKATDFYTNLEMARAQVKDTGKPFWAFAQAGAVSTASGTIASTYCPTAAEQQWEINAALAMGARGIQYWQLFQGTTYAGEDGDYARSGLIGANGQVNTTYYNAAKELNAFIAVIDEVLMNAENEGVIVNDSTASGALSSAVKLSSYQELASVTGTNAMVGCFDYYGKTALLLVNCNTSSAQNIKLTFNEECQAYVTKMGATEVNRTTASTLSANSVTVNVNAGQSALVIVE